MKIVVIGGSGLIGKQVVRGLRERGHDVLAASPSTGVNALTGEGLSAALAGAEVVVDVANSPSFEPSEVLAFFESSGRNLLAAEREAGVGHHIALSVVGTDRLPDNGYMRAKNAQEALIRAGDIPYTIVRATQFYEFLGAIGDSCDEAGTLRLPAALFQPMAAADVAAALVDIAEQPRGGKLIELAGPEKMSMHDAVARFLATRGDKRPTLADANALYYGTTIDDSSLTPGANPHLGATTLDQWLAASG